VSVGTQRSVLGTWRLVSLGAALVALLVLLVALQCRPPLGYSPRIGDELDVTAFFPAAWRLLPRPSEVGYRLLVAAVLVALWAVYGLALRLVGRDGAPPRSRFAILAAVTVVAQLLLLTAPPVVCNDLFHYALFGRMVNATSFNPYLTPGSALVGDPIRPYATWSFVPSHYGPTFTWLSALAVRLGGDGVRGTALAFKGMAITFNLAAAWLARAIARGLRRGDGSFAFAAYAWNPLVLYECAVSGHNEPVMIALALAGLLLFQRGRPWLAFVFLALSVDIKQVTAALALFLAVRFVFDPADWRRRSARALGLLGLVGAVAVVLWLPFWAGPKVFSTSHQLMTAGSFSRIASLVFTAGILLMARFAAHAELARILDLAAGAIFVFVVVVFPFAYPWYSMTPLALLAVNAGTRPRLMALGVVALWGAMLTLQYTIIHGLG
jgi:hypothetical protein